MLSLLFQSVLRGEFEVILLGFILSDLLTVWSEIAQVLALGQEEREDVKLSAR